MFSFIRSTKFRRDVRRCQRQHKDLDLFKAIHELLIAGKPLPAQYHDHVLIGNWSNPRSAILNPIGSLGLAKE